MFCGLSEFSYLNYRLYSFCLHWTLLTSAGRVIYISLGGAFSVISFRMAVILWP